MFYESQTNVSGSLNTEHRNILNDPTNSYEVQVITLQELLRQIEKKTVAIMKVDIEGEEYEFVKSVSVFELQKIEQLIIEFHHDIVRSSSMTDTIQAIKRLQSLGMKSELCNGRDCLFY